MNKRLLFPFIFSLLLCGCKANAKTTSIFIASDLHYLASSLETNEGDYRTSDLTKDGRIQENDELYLDAFIEQINKEKPNILILSGDLAFNGEKISHLELKEKLKKITSTQILVIPGNHDIMNLNSYDYSLKDSPQKIDSITYEEFEEIYADFGYSKALEKDKNSLSYVYEANDNCWILMIDSSCSYKNIEGYMHNEGYIKENTMTWIETVLKKAKEKQIQVIPVSHHNLNTHNPNFTSYEISNAYSLKLLYETYQIPIHFSGHMHIQHIQKSPVVYDICSSSLLDYGNRFGKIQVNGSSISYHSERLHLEKEIQEQSYQHFYDCYYPRVYQKFASMEVVNHPEEIADLYSMANCYYFDGDQENIHRLNIEKKDLIQWMKDTFFDYEESYYCSILKEEKISMHELNIK